MKYKPEGGLPLFLKKVVCECVKWIHLARNRVQRRSRMDTVMNRRVPWKAENSLTWWVTV